MELLALGALGVATYAILNAVNAQNEIAARHASTEAFTAGVRGNTAYGDNDTGDNTLDYTEFRYTHPETIWVNPSNYVFAPQIADAGVTARGLLRTDITSGRYTRAPTGYLTEHF